MNGILEYLNQQSPWITELGHASMIFIITLSMVYILGRMLGVLHGKLLQERVLDYHNLVLRNGLNGLVGV